MIQGNVNPVWKKCEGHFKNSYWQSVSCSYNLMQAFLVQSFLCNRVKNIYYYVILYYVLHYYNIIYIYYTYTYNYSSITYIHHIYIYIYIIYIYILHYTWYMVSLRYICRIWGLCVSWSIYIHRYIYMYYLYIHIYKLYIS